MRGFFQEAVVLIGALLRPAARSVRENSGLAALSVVLAFGLWIFVTDAENPEQTGRLDEAIPVRAVNIPAGVAEPHDLGEVGIELRAERNVFDSLTKDDFEATVDLEGLSVGEYRVPVKVEPVAQRGNLRIVDIITPEPNDEIRVRLAQLMSKEVPIELEITGTLPTDHAVAATELGSETAVVLGAQEDIATVTTAVAVADIEGRTETFEGAVRLEARTQQGVLVQDIDIDPTTVEVRVEIEQRSFSRALAVNPRIVGEPRQGYNFIGITVDPPVVTVFGPESFITAAASIDTQPIDIAEESDDVVKTVSLDLPADVTVLGGAEVTVTVNIRPAPGQLLFEVPVTADGLEGGVRISGALPSVRVFVFGPLPELLDLNTSDISATVDLGGKEPGTHRVKIEVTVPDGLEVRSIAPQEADVVLEPS